MRDGASSAMYGFRDRGASADAEFLARVFCVFEGDTCPPCFFEAGGSLGECKGSIDMDGPQRYGRRGPWRVRLSLAEAGSPARNAE